MNIVKYDITAIKNEISADSNFTITESIEVKNTPELALRNLKDTTKLLRTLGNPTEFRAFDDKSKNLGARKFSGNFEEISAELETLNDEGYGIFAVINVGGQKDADITKVNAVFADFDGTPIPSTFPLPPSMVVQSSISEKQHVYWLVADDFPIQQFKPIQQAIAYQLGSDNSISNLSRVMRLPGFIHQKNEPVLTKLLSYNPERQYSLCDLQRAFKSNNKSSQPIQKSRIPFTISSVKQGGRNNALISIAGIHWNQGCNEHDVLAILLVHNQRFNPPLPEAEVQTVARSVTRYEQPIPASEAALVIANELKSQIVNSIILVAKNCDAELISLCVLEYAIARIIEGCWWEEPKSKFVMLKPLDRGESLIRSSEKDFTNFISNTFGSIFIQEILQLEFAKSDVKLTDLKTVVKTSFERIAMHIKIHSQRRIVNQFVDMFAEKPQIIIQRDLVDVYFTHIPFNEGPIDERIINDYRQHFILFDEVLDLIAYSRFASDRKKSYLWIKAASDWGKGLFIAALGELGASVNLSVNECEKLLSGDPVGLQPELFIKANTLIFDEFKTVKSELKQLQNSIPVTPKNQMTSNVEVFTKLFFSAENVNSLVGDQGVEDQFCNRFSKIVGFGSIEERPLFMENTGAYRISLTNHMAATFNNKYAELIAMGREQADILANKVVRDFHTEHGLDKHHDRLSTSIEEIANAIVAKIVNHILKGQIYIEQEARIEIKKPRQQRFAEYGLKNGYILLKNPSDYVDRWIECNVEFSQRISIKRKRSEIMQLISTEGKETAKSLRDEISGNVLRGILVRPLHDQYSEAISIYENYLVKEQS